MDFDPLQYFSWWSYAVFGVVYTALVFRGELSKEGRVIFSELNPKPLSIILTFHCVFLAFLMGLMKVTVFIYPSLPDWLTNTFRLRGADHSFLDLFFIFVMIVLHYVERKWLCIVPKTDSPEASE